jgi:photosystem II stability/assembly factor-like uncharacterized protein
MADVALLAGTEAGLYILRSKDDGKTWSEPKVALPETDVTDLAAAPDGTVYVGTVGRGVLRGADGLTSFTETDTPDALKKVRSLHIDGDSVLAGSESRPHPVGVFRWQEHEEWQELGDLTAGCSGSAEWHYPVPTIGVHVRHVSRDPHKSERLYAAMQVGGVAISPDNGQSWYDRRNLDLDVHMIEADPRRPGVVYAGSGGGGLFKSTDYGDSWELTSEECGRFVVQFAIDPDVPDRLFLGTARGGVRSWQTDPAGARGEMWRSDDAGAHWRKLAGGLPEFLASRVGAMHIAVHNSKQVFFGCDNPRGGKDNGVYQSLDSGETWRKILPLPDVAAISAVAL